MSSFNRYDLSGRGSGFGGGGRMQFFPPVIKWLLIINTAVFLLGYLVQPYDLALNGVTYQGIDDITRYAALWPLGHPLFGVWQYFTYMFVHAGVMHIFFNMLILWMFGMELEQMWGSDRFLVYYLVCGVGAGVVHSLVSLAMGSGAPTVGASGAIMGVMVAFAMNFPDRIILVGFFFPLKAKYAILLLGAFDLYSGFAATDNVAHFAHLGGALIGFLLLQFGGKMTLGGIFDRLPKFTGTRVAKPAPPQQRFSGGKVIDAQFRDVPPRNVPPTMDFGDDQDRIDEILDKISRTGYQNLTEEEKEILMQASKKMK